MGQPVTKRTDLRVLVGILVGALVLRALYLWSYAQALPFWSHPFGDSILDLDWARRIAAGAFSGPAAFHRAPLYAYLVAAILKLTGNKLAVVYLVQSGLGIATAVLVYSLASRLRSGRAALFALLLVGLSGILVCFESKLLSTTWAVFFALAGTYATVLALDARNAARAPRVTGLAFGLAGLAFGIAALAWPGVILVAVLTVVFVLTRAGWRMALLVGAGCALGIAPATLHNACVERDFVLVSANSGFTFYQGNNRLAAGTLAHPPEVYQFRVDGRYLTGIADQERFEREYVSRRMGRAAKSSEVSGFWMQRAIGWIGSDPAGFLVLLGRKLVLALSDHESPSNYNFDLELETVWPLRLLFVRFGLLLTLAAVGVATVRLPRSGPVYALVVGGFAPLLTFYVAARYRALVVPGLAVLGGIGLSELMNRIRARKGWIRPLGAGVAVLLLSNVLFTVPLRRGSELLRANGYRNAGEVLLERAGDTLKARIFLERSVRILEANVNARSLPERVALAEARMLLDRTRGPGIEPAGLEAAKQALAEHDSLRARELLEAALARDSGLKEAYLLLGSIRGSWSQADEARRVFEAAARRFPDDPVVLYNLAYAALAQGDFRTALAVAERVLELVPGHPWAVEVRARAKQALK